MWEGGGRGGGVRGRPGTWQYTEQWPRGDCVAGSSTSAHKSYINSPGGGG
jgi:hypothetical protein